MAAPAHVFCLAKVWVLLMSAPTVQGDFLEGDVLQGLKLRDPTKLHATQFSASKFTTNLKHLDQVELPSAIQVSAKVRAVQDRAANSAELAEGLRKGVAIKAKAEEATADAQQVAAGLARKGAEAASAKLEGVPVSADKALSEAKKVVEVVRTDPTRVGVGALRGASSHVAETVNQTSLHLSEFLQSFGPKASAMIRRSGEALACKLSGDCVQDRAAPIDIERPESWAFWSFALLLVLALCAAFTIVVRCIYAAGRQGTILLTEALVPLTEKAAREPTLQMSAPTRN